MAGGGRLGLGPLVDLAVESGFRQAWVGSASRAEWEGLDTDIRLAAHPDQTLAAGTRERVDRQRSSGVNGYRDVLGISYPTLVPAAGS